MERETVLESMKTPFKRLIAGILISEGGQFIALMAPLMILLVFKVMEIDPEHYTVSFGMITGFGALFAAFANPIGGALSDRTSLKFGRRRTWILIGSVLGSASLMGIALSTKVWMVGMFWCAANLFFNFGTASATALVPDQVDESRRGTISGIIGLVVPFSGIVGMLIMTMMGQTPLILRYTVLAVIGTVTALVSVALIKEGKVVYKTAENEKISFGQLVSKIYPSPRKYPLFTWGWLNRFFISLAFCSSSYNTIMIMQRYQLSQDATSQTVTLVTVIMMASLAAGCVIGGILSDKFRKQKLFIIISGIILAIGVTINIFAPSVTYIMISAVFYGFGYGMFLAVDAALIARILPNEKDAAKDFGIMNIANTVPQSIVPFIAPTVLGIGGWRFLFASLSICAVLSILAIIPLPEMSKKPIENRQKKSLEESLEV